MLRFGRFLVIIGLGSFVLHFLNMEFIVLSWVDNWGAGTGNVIRVAMIVVGAVLWVLGGRKPAQDAPPAT
jgi:hypothetical protein